MSKKLRVKEQAAITPAEETHAQRTEQMEAIYAELNWLSEQPVTQPVKALAGLLWDRVSFVNQQAELQEQRAARWETLATGAIASAQEFQTQRDSVLDEMNSLLNGDHPAIATLLQQIIADGSHPLIVQLVEEAKQEAFEEYQANAGRLLSFAQRIKEAEKKGA